MTVSFSFALAAGVVDVTNHDNITAASTVMRFILALSELLHLQPSTVLRQEFTPEAPHVKKGSGVTPRTDRLTEP